MLNSVTISRHNDGRWLKVTAMTTTSKMLMLLTILTLLLRALASTTTLAESELNNLNAKEITKLTKNVATIVKQSKQELRQFPFNGFMVPPPSSASLPSCPLCDSSVYSYCSHKLIHDSCCCDFPGAAIYQKPSQCAYYDCMLLYAKSCYEHSLIKNCCCNNPY